MKHLEKFYNYINESDTYSKEEMDELLVPIRDLGVGCEIGDKTTITEGKFSGSEYLSVRFTFNDYEKTPGFGYRTDIMSDDRIWDFFDELISLRNRLENDKILIHFYNSKYGSYGVTIMFVTGEVKDNKLFELEKVYNVLRTRSNSGTTDFYYSMIMKLDKEETAINIEVSQYTSRKFKYFTRQIDMSGFDISTETSEGSYGYGGTKANIKITPKG